MADEDENRFISRWSRRKSVARVGAVEGESEQVSSLAPEIDQGTNGTENELIDTTASTMLDETDFADVNFDELDKSSDYTRFIKENVPAAIQRRAFRKLWASDSVFEVLDGLNDYDGDFTGNGLAGKLFKTAHKVGRGFITDEDIEPEDSENLGESDEDLSVEPRVALDDEGSVNKKTVELDISSNIESDEADKT